MFWLMLTCRVALEPAKASRTRRASARGRQHLLRPCRATAAEELEQMPLKALLFDCDGESHVDTGWALPTIVLPQCHASLVFVAPNIYGCIAGVILLSEELHRVAYNAAFENFDVRPNGKDEIANW